MNHFNLWYRQTVRLKSKSLKCHIASTGRFLSNYSQQSRLVTEIDTYLRPNQIPSGLNKMTLVEFKPVIVIESKLLGAMFASPVQDID